MAELNQTHDPALIMAYTPAKDFVVLTHDLDFGAILAATHGEKPSVGQLRADDVNPDVVGPKVLAAIRQTEAELQAGALLTVDSNRTRLRTHETMRLLPVTVACGSMGTSSGARVA